MVKTDFSIFPELHTERLLLKEMTADDVQVVFEMRSDPELMNYLDRPIMHRIEEAKEWLQNVLQRQIKKEGISWGIYRKENPIDNIGNIGLFNIKAEHYRAEMGYMLKSEWHRQGIMYEALQAVITFAFDGMKLHSLEANINPDNTASKMLLKKSGFVKEAYFRENCFFNGKFIDSEIYSLINK